MTNRSTGTRPRWPTWAVVLAVTAAVLVIGVATVIVAGPGGDDDVVATSTSAVSTSTTDAAATSTTVTPTTHEPTTTLDPDHDFTAIVYFLADGVNDTAQSGPYLVPVAVPASDSEVEIGTMVALLAGPADDLPGTISSAIPDGTVLRGIELRDEVAVVDLSAEFQNLQGSFGTVAGVAQVVWTLTAFDHIEAVEFEIDGEPTWVLGGEGLVFELPITRQDFYPGIGHAWDDGPQTGLVPAILIESPAWGWPDSGYPLLVTGIANVFEGTVDLALTDSEGLIPWEGFATASCGTGCWGEWGQVILYELEEPQMGALIAWERSARDGSQVNVREHPVWLVPGPAPMPGACSGTEAEGDLVEQPTLPPAVAGLRSDIFEAARACDWEALSSLVDDDFVYRFGVDDDPIAYWRALEESRADEPMRYLAELLNLPYSSFLGDGPTYFVWPWAFDGAWAEVPDKERALLEPLYGAGDFAAWDATGAYLGYRIALTDSGRWAFFVAGD